MQPGPGQRSNGRGSEERTRSAISCRDDMGDGPRGKPTSVGRKGCTERAGAVGTSASYVVALLCLIGTSCGPTVQERADAARGAAGQTASGILRTDLLLTALRGYPEDEDLQLARREGVWAERSGMGDPRCSATICGRTASWASSGEQRGPHGFGQMGLPVATDHWPSWWQTWQYCCSWQL